LASTLCIDSSWKKLSQISFYRLVAMIMEQAHTAYLPGELEQQVARAFKE
jgi:hypothetical protein